jgi:sugar phosphate isomerase/epimerase
VRIGFNTWSLARVGYQEFIPRLAEIGYRAMAISVVPGYTIGGSYVANAMDLHRISKDDRQRIKRGLQERDLTLASVVGNQSLLHTDADRHAEAMSRLRGAVDLCVELAGPAQPTPTMNTGTGGQSGELEGKEQLLLDRLGELTEYASGKGVVVCIEPHVSTPIDTPERAEWLINAMASPYLRLDFDVSHFEVQCIAMTESVPRLAPLASAIEIKDQRVYDKGSREGWVDGNGWGESHGRQFQFLLGGEGTFDLAAYLRLVREAGWSESIAFEASVQCQARPDYDGLREAERTYGWMAAGWQAAGISQ